MTVHIHRYEIGPGVTHVPLPVDACILSAAIKPQDETVSIWAVVDTETKTEVRTFAVIGTGENLGKYTLTPDKEAYFIATTLAIGPRCVLVWHVFELRTKVKP